MCGIIGIFNTSSRAANDVYLGLMNLQHRGKETAGIASYNDGRLHVRKGPGEIAQVFPWDDSLASLKGSVAIGQTKYTTMGDSHDPRNTQPIINTFRGVEYSMGHNGNIVNINHENACELVGVSDTYLTAERISQSTKKDFVDAVIEVMEELEGSFNLIFLYMGKIIVAMDRFGFHPMSLGKKNLGYVVASETCAIDQIGAEWVLDLAPGEMLIIDDYKYEKFTWTKKECELKFDLFEMIYFMRPDSYAHGVEAGLARYYMGMKLARRFPVDADIHVPVPNSANEAALGCFDESLLSFPETRIRPWSIFRSHYIGRTFIEPIAKDREMAIRQKMHFRDYQFYNKITEEIDDSIIRANTVRNATRLTKKAGAKEIHFFSASPQYIYPDIYGVDTYRVNEELIMRKLHGDESLLASELDIEQVAFLPLDECIDSVLDAQEYLIEINKFRGKKRFTNSSFYTGPFTGEYPDGTGLCRIE